MDIWNLLNTSPTTDKKTIKKAYAARTRVIHPEEKPDEFRQLHDAYKKALDYAERAHLSEKHPGDAYTPPENPETKKRQPTAGQMDHETIELLSGVALQQKRQQNRLAAFMLRWKDLQDPHLDSRKLAQWKEYLASDDFRHIQYLPQLLHFLAENTDQKRFRGDSRVRLLLWDAYGFREDEEKQDPDGLGKLWCSLVPAVIQQKEELLARQKYEKDKRFRKKLFLALLLACGVLVIFTYCYVNVRNRRQLMEYMASHYPETAFSKPQKDHTMPDGSFLYTLYPLSHPDLTVHARVLYLDYKHACQITEDYSTVLLEYYAGQYGLLCERTTDPPAINDVIMQRTNDDSFPSDQRGVLYYPNIEQVDSFCQTVARMFQEQKELRSVAPVGICAEHILFPQVLLYGCVYDFSPSDPQFYAAQTMTAAELEARIREAYILYMFCYEPWNLTNEQYHKWGSSYDRLSARWSSFQGTYYDLKDPDTRELLCRPYLFVYDGFNPDYIPYSRYPFASVHVKKTSVGNAYFSLLEHGAHLTVHEDGSGFTVISNGESWTFGAEPEVKLSILNHLYEDTH